jgi:hypothetical protein
MAATLDEIEQLLELKESLLPQLRKDLKAGLTGDEIYEKYKAIAAARVVSIVATEVDSGKALAASKEVLDRSGGKAAEKKEVTHRYGKLKDEQLDSVLLSMSGAAAAAEEADEGSKH